MEINTWQITARGVLALMSLLLAVSCATEQKSQPAPAAVPQPLPAPMPAPLPRQTRAKSSGVRASFQGQEEAGHITASGEPYDPEDLTAASKTLPIGSTVVVTNPETGKSVKVRINDRGPYVRGRSLDLSSRAAKAIGITEKGVARVRVKRVASKPARKESSSSSAESASTSTP